MTRRVYDVRVYLKENVASWSAEYDSVWDATSAAFAFAEKRGAEAWGVSALAAHDEAAARWDCGCGNLRVPAWCVRCDRCGAARPRQ